MPCDFSPVVKSIAFDFPPGKFVMPTTHGERSVLKVELGLRLRRRNRVIPVSKILQYSNEERGLVQGVEICLPDECPGVASFYRDASSGHIHLAVTTEERKQEETGDGDKPTYDTATMYLELEVEANPLAEARQDAPPR
jgi:hypothetical protein